MSEKKDPCAEGHDLKHAMYLTTSYTPHVAKPTTLSVAVHMFLCRECGHPFSSHQELPRSYLADGTITKEMEEELKEMRITAEVNKRLKLIIEAGKQQQSERQLAGATKAGGTVDGSGESGQQSRGADQAESRASAGG